MSGKRIPRVWWYRVMIGLLAVFSWGVAVTAFAGRLSALGNDAPQSATLTVAGWGLGLCAFVLLADLLGSRRSSNWHPDA